MFEIFFQRKKKCIKYNNNSKTWKNGRISCLFLYCKIVFCYSFVNTHFHITHAKIAFEMKCGGWRSSLFGAYLSLHSEECVCVWEERKKNKPKIKIPKKCWKCDKHVFHLNVFKSCFDLICNICLWLCSLLHLLCQTIYMCWQMQFWIFFLISCTWIKGEMLMIRNNTK